MATVRAAELQGNSIVAFNKPFQNLLGISATSPAEARCWLRQILPLVTTCEQVLRLRQRRRLVAQTQPGISIPNTVWLQLSFAHAGLRLLSGDHTGFEGTSFASGLPFDSIFRGVPEVNFHCVDQSAHLLLIVAADSKDEVDKATEALRHSAVPCGLHTVFVESGNQLREGMKGREHFGFVDGISQPTPKWVEKSGVLEGDFDDFLIPPGSQNKWAANGTFLVYTRFTQDVEKFHTLCNTVSTAIRTAGGPGVAYITPDYIASRLLGRWRNGTPLVDGRSPSEQVDTHNDFDFLNDSAGRGCPFAAHIRKSSPRDTEDWTRKHRLLRRGISFGDPWPAPGARGLHFIAYQRSIEDQFEFICKRWMQDDGFPVRGAGRDPLIGTAGGRDVLFRIAYENTSTHREEEMAFKSPGHLITANMGGYFLTPSLSGLEFLCTP